ncbi:DMT family transporter [Paenochrobactrum sp. BZR 588]|uniref:DMT family transporter n=1 Tax=Paenochrobactrum TaxID=999488 RepID=UPI0035BC0773
MFASSKKTPVNLAMIALFLGGVAIGTSPIFVRLSETGPLATAFWRLALALLPLLAIDKIFITPVQRAETTTWSDYFELGIPGLFLAGDLALWHAALNITTVANATLLANMAPIFVAAGAWIFLGIRPTRPFVIGLILACIGLVVLKGGVAGLTDGQVKGDGLALIAAMFYAGYILFLGKLRAKFTAMQIMIASTISASLAMLIVSVAFETNLFPLTLYGWGILIGLALIAHAGGQGLITYALAYLPASFSSLTLLIQPVVAAILAWLILNEPIGMMQIIGGIIIICGILFARRS